VVTMEWRVRLELLRQISKGPDDLGRGSSTGCEYLEDPAVHNDIDIE